MKKRRVWYSIATSAVIVSVALAVWVDMRAAIEANAKLDALTTNSALSLIHAKTAKELKDFDRCSKSADEKELRDCIVAAMKEAKTDWMAYMFIWSVKSWMIRHPEDHEVRDAARHVLAEGWKDLERTRYLSDAARSLEIAAANSVLYSISDEIKTGRWDRQRRIESLKEAEAMIPN